MVQGNFANGDYFINCDFISLSALRATFGVWINVCVATIAICIRSIFRYRIKHFLLSDERKVNLWRTSPAVTTSEVFELRGILARALMEGDFAYVFASAFCVVTALVGAASTVISNHAVVMNPVIRDAVVPGQNVTHSHNSLSGALIDVSTRVTVLDRAKAPLNELFDFVPSDNAHWIYKATQWNNTWRGDCTFTKHDAVELKVYASNSSDYYQDVVPLLGHYIPAWAVDPAKQGAYYVGLWESQQDHNDTGSWTNVIATYVFGTAPANDPTWTTKFANVSIVNYLAHGIGRDPQGMFIETAFKSDVHVVECSFVNAVDNGTKYQAKGPGGSYSSAAQNIGDVSSVITFSRCDFWLLTTFQLYSRGTVVNTTNHQPVIQPTGEQMLRSWQAYMSVKDAQYPNPDVRTLTMVQDTVQIRLSALLTSVVAFLLAAVMAYIARYRGVKNNAHKLHLPSSQLDWMVQAARELSRSQLGTKSPNEFAIQNKDSFFIISPHLEPCIAMASDTLELSSPKTPTSSSLLKEEDYDPWSGYYFASRRQYD